MIKNNRNNEQIYGRNDMVMLDQNNKIYGSLGIADKYVMKTEEGTRLVLNNPKSGRFGDVLTEFNIYGKSEQFSTTGAQLLNENIETTSRGVTIKINGSTAIFKGTVSDENNVRVHCQKSIELKPGEYIVSSSNEKIVADFLVVKANGENIYNSHIEIDGTEKTVYVRILFGLKPSAKGDVINETTNVMINDGDIALPYEPYTGGKPSPSPDYPQEIVSVGGNGSIEVNVRGKNLVDIYGYSASDIPSPEEKRVLSNEYGTTLSTTDKTDKLIVHQEIIDGANPNSYTSGYFCIGINPKLEVGKYYIISFKINVIQNPLHVSDTVVMFNGIDPYSAQVVGDKVTVKAKYNEYNERQYVEFRVRGMSLEFSNFMITEVGETDDYEPYHEEQTVTLPYTLNAIPVLSGGNYTDQSGQQWICDEINLKRGVKVQRVYEVNVDGENIKFVQSDRYANISVRGLPIALICNGQRTYGISTFTSLSWFFNAVNGQFLYLIEPDISDKINESCKKQIGKIYYALETPIETALTPAEISAYKELSTKTPTTIIENNYNTWMKATYKSIESV